LCVNQHKNKLISQKNIIGTFESGTSRDTFSYRVRILSYQMKHTPQKQYCATYKIYDTALFSVMSSLLSFNDRTISKKQTKLFTSCIMFNGFKK